MQFLFGYYMILTSPKTTTNPNRNYIGALGLGLGWGLRIRVEGLALECQGLGFSVGDYRVFFGFILGFRV